MASSKTILQQNFDLLFPANEPREFFRTLLERNNVDAEDIIEYDEFHQQIQNFLTESIASMSDDLIRVPLIFNDLIDRMQPIIDYKTGQQVLRSTILSSRLQGLLVSAQYFHYYVASLNIEVVLIEACNDPGAVNSLNHFIRTAGIIRADEATYAESISSQIEAFMLDPVELMNSQDPPRNLQIITDRGFIALAAPSLVGKTQLAFLLRRKLPFYFVLSEMKGGFTQSVYKNFFSASEKLVAFAERDYSLILSRNPRRQRMLLRDSTPDYQYISATNILSEFTDRPSWTLGFFKSLAEHARINFNADTQDWMSYMASQKTLNVQPISIRDFMAISDPHPLANYCVFLDEFREDFSSVFIRNLIRALGVNCLVSNTNTYIANLTGSRHVGSRSESAILMWALVVCDLDPFNRQILNEIFNWPQLIDSILNSMSASCREQFERFINDVFNRQLDHVRPGIAIFFADALRMLSALPNLPDFDVAECIDFVIKYISNQMFTRKSRMASEIGGQLGNFALHSSVAFERRSDLYHLMNLKVFLEDHLFFLVNPVRNESWFFFLFRETSGHLRINVSDHLDLWTELSYFKAEEFLTLLACHFGTLRKPAAVLINESIVRSNRKNISNFPNPRAKTNSGLELEISATVSVIDASHYTMHTGTELFSPSLSGVKFFDFLANLLRNRLLSRWAVGSLPSTKKIVLLSVPESLAATLESFTVPFLGPSNLAWPGQISSVFSETPINLGTYQRTPNRAQIDGIFDIFNASTNSRFKGVVECKDLASDLLAREIEELIRKARRQGRVKVILIFCNAIGGNMIQRVPEASRIHLLHEYLTRSGINLYRFSPLPINGGITFRILPYRPDTPISPDPKAIAFIFSKNDINRTMPRFH